MSKSVKIAPGAMVCNECELRGDITIGSMTVIHPRASIVAEAGPIIIGECNIIEEQTHIINRGTPGEANPTCTPVMIIGANNVFEIDCYSEALKIGDNNVLEAKSFVGRAVELTNGCIVGAACKLSCPEVVPENTVIFGSKCSRRQQADRPPPQTLQLDYLTKVLPNYHHLKKPPKKVSNA
ncbi:dynactin subunit 6 [Zootermopsis nevadensis]|uniref:Dynactin subunit 6 n=1 Tax=Zootermopsis nevadensis TaxID=136037 RepID=A0A067R469_ZOONE|nr:dynactin subunit 6 [Zootermopsis nevadensis]KDR17944.1 Dynactin subunit 6 [Zootermopsis nevadensis]